MHATNPWPQSQRMLSFGAAARVRIKIAHLCQERELILKKIVADHKAK